jgi:2-dehydropantoate 2-reductase
VARQEVWRLGRHGILQKRNSLKPLGDIMRILVVGAGAIGGYFGSRLLQAGRDVTFLVRPRRADELAKHGLSVQSQFGGIEIANPPVVLAENLRQPFDLILLSCKAYDLDGAIASFTPAVGPGTAILPLLNGMRHMEALDSQFGANRVIGGLCIISTTLDSEGRILHLNDVHMLAFGERDGGTPSRIEALNAALTNANFDARLSTAIMQEMWEKWVFIASAAGITCLMRASVGDIVAADGADLATQLHGECAAIAAANGFPPRLAAMERNRAILTAPGSPLTASMLRDIERGARTEADHILGDLLHRQRAPGDALSLLRVAYAHMKAYEVRRVRETA